MPGWRGHLSYFGARGEVRGEEEAVIQLAPNGLRTLSVTCRIYDTDIWRHCIITVDSAFRPVDTYVRVCEAGRDLGAGWFRFDAQGVTASLRDGSGQAHEQRVTVDRPVAAFGSHPVISDSWHGAGLDQDRQGQAQTVAPYFTTSLSYNGREAPALLRNDLNFTVHGRETVTVPAGVFDCFHFELDDSFRPPERRRHYHIWCSADGAFHFIKGRAFGYKPTLYVLDRWGPLA